MPIYSRKRKQRKNFLQGGGVLINLESNQGDVFQIDSDYITLSPVWSNLIEEYDGTSIACPTLSSLVLAKLLEFMNHYNEEPMTPLDTDGIRKLDDTDNPLQNRVQPWYVQFATMSSISEPDNVELIFDVLMAANQYNILPLIHLMCAKIAAMFMSSKNNKELGDKFGCSIPSSMSPEERNIFFSDPSTSFLDNRTEEEKQQDMEGVKKGGTKYRKQKRNYSKKYKYRY
jgi:hypothetical protein